VVWSIWQFWPINDIRQVSDRNTYVWHLTFDIWHFFSGLGTGTTNCLSAEACKPAPCTWQQPTRAAVTLYLHGRKMCLNIVGSLAIIATNPLALNRRALAQLAYFEYRAAGRLLRCHLRGCGGCNYTVWDCKISFKSNYSIFVLRCTFRHCGDSLSAFWNWILIAGYRHSDWTLS